MGLNGNWVREKLVDLGPKSQRSFFLSNWGPKKLKNDLLRVKRQPHKLFKGYLKFKEKWDEREHSVTHLKASLDQAKRRAAEE